MSSFRKNGVWKADFLDQYEGVKIFKISIDVLIELQLGFPKQSKNLLTHLANASNRHFSICGVNSESGWVILAVAGRGRACYTTSLAAKILSLSSNFTFFHVKMVFWALTMIFLHEIRYFNEYLLVFDKKKRFLTIK